MAGGATTPLQPSRCLFRGGPSGEMLICCCGHCGGVAAGSGPEVFRFRKAKDGTSGRMILGQEEYELLGNRSRYGEMVRTPDPGISQILAPATNNKKLTRPDQPRWVAGRWRGMWMYTVYLEELATCMNNACPP